MSGHSCSHSVMRPRSVRPFWSLACSRLMCRVRAGCDADVSAGDSNATLGKMWTLSACPTVLCTWCIAAAVERLCCL